MVLRRWGLTVPGNLYVANNFHSTVTVYAPGSTSVLMTVSSGVNQPDALVFSPYGSYFVGNTGNNTVTVYDPGRNDVRADGIPGHQRSRRDRLRALRPRTLKRSAARRRRISSKTRSAFGVRQDVGLFPKLMSFI